MKNLKPTIGAFIVAKNEERDLGNALKSVSWCDQIVVINMASVDNTVAIAKSFGAEVYDFEDCGYVEPALQYATEKLNTDYLFRLDADEMINIELKNFIIEQAALGEFDIFYVRRVNYIFGDFSKNNRYYKDKQLRFWKAGTIEHTSKIHTHPIMLSEKIYRAPLDEKAAIIHFNQRTIYEYVEKMNRYTEKEPLESIKVKSIFYEFFVNYLLKLLVLCIKNAAYKKTTDFTIEYLTSTYHFVKILKAKERARNLNVLEMYQQIADDINKEIVKPV